MRFITAIASICFNLAVWLGPRVLSSLRPKTQCIPHLPVATLGPRSQHHPSRTHPQSNSHLNPCRAKPNILGSWRLHERGMSRETLNPSQNHTSTHTCRTYGGPRGECFRMRGVPLYCTSQGTQSSQRQTRQSHDTHQIKTSVHLQRRRRRDRFRQECWRGVPSRGPSHCRAPLALHAGQGLRVQLLRNGLENVTLTERQL